MLVLKERVTKRKRLQKADGTPLDRAIKRNVKRFEEDKKKRPGIAGSHPGSPKKKMMPDFEKIRIALADVWLHAKSYNVIHRCLQMLYLTKWEEKYYEGHGEKRKKEGMNLRWRRFKYANDWVRSVWPKAPITGKFEHDHRSVSGMVKRATLSAKSPEIIALAERQEAEYRELMKQIHGEEALKQLEAPAEAVSFTEIERQNGESI